MTSVPKTGTGMPAVRERTSYSHYIAQALARELGQTHRAVKTAMAWTGACERSAKKWLSGESGPNGEHLIELMRHSDHVLSEVLRRAGRDEALVPDKVRRVRVAISEALVAIDLVLEDNPIPPS